MKILAFLIPDDVRCVTQQLPALRELHAETGIEMEMINPCEHPELAIKFDVPIVPTTVILNAHDEIHAVNHGYGSAKTLRRLLQSDASKT